MAKKSFATDPDVFGPFRLAFPAVFVPRAAQENATEKYSINMLFPKNDQSILPEVKYYKGLTELRKLAYMALFGKWGKERDKWPGTLRALFGGPNGATNLQTYLSPTGKDGWPFRDGDQVGDKYEGFSGHIYVRAASGWAPGVVDAGVKRILNPDLVFGGLICLAQINAYTYEEGGTPGVTFGLNNLQILKDDGTNFQGRVSPEDVFTAASGVSGAYYGASAPSGQAGDDPFGAGPSVPSTPSAPPAGDDPFGTGSPPGHGVETPGDDNPF